jgi:nitric oxide dioxygenase
MTTTQITLVQQSFKKLHPMAQAAGELFYHKLFEAAPQARTMFKSPIAGQANKLMYTLGYVVAHLHTPQTIMTDVQRLAIRHNQYGAQPAHYALVGGVLLETLAEGLGSDWNAELQSAWVAAYQLVANAMMEAQTPSQVNSNAA